MYDSTRNDRKALALEAIQNSGAAYEIVAILTEAAAAAGISPSQVYGDMDSLTRIWSEGAADAWADLFCSDDLRALIAWQKTPAARAMMAAQPTMRTLGSTIMERAIEQNLRGVS